LNVKLVEFLVAVVKFLDTHMHHHFQTYSTQIQFQLEAQFGLLKDSKGISIQTIYYIFKNSTGKP